MSGNRFKCIVVTLLLLAGCGISPVTDDRQEDFSRRKRKYDSPLFSVKSGLSRFYCKFAVLSLPQNAQNSRMDRFCLGWRRGG